LVLVLLLLGPEKNPQRDYASAETLTNSNLLLANAPPPT
jgi:hypothetical protein